MAGYCGVTDENMIEDDTMDNEIRSVLTPGYESPHD